MSSDNRRKVFERIVARNEARGTPLETGPSFLAKVDEWIEGEIDITELRQFYAELLRSRRRHTEM